MSAEALALTQAFPRRWPPANPVVIDRAGLPVDVSGRVWRLNAPSGSKVLNWDLVKLPEGEVLDAFRCFVVHQIKTNSSWTTYNTFNRALALLHTPAAMSAAETGSPIPYLAFSEARAALGSKKSWQLHEGRMLYRWCRRQRFTQFSADVQDMADRLVLGGNPKGRAVRSHDPEEGPLTVQEVASIVSALKAHRLQGTIPIVEQAAVILCLAFGSNASQFASLREEDLMPIRADSETTGYILSVPRHKKGHRHLRAAFRRRKLNTFMGGIINDLCESNRAQPHPGDNFSRPLFRRDTPSHVRGNIDEEWLYHYSADEFTGTLQRAVARLGVMGRDGKPLKVTTRRMRYTFATRMVSNGASRAAVADALDHSDLQHVPVYWDMHSDIVEHLDRAVAMALAPRAQALSEATTRAYAASAEALKLNVLAYGGTLLDLDIFTERLTASVEDPYGVDVTVEIRSGLEIAFPLVTTSMKEWRRRGPGSPTEMLVRALGRLAMMRVWRHRGTVAPPAGLLQVNGLGKALVERAGVDPQAFFDASWAPVRIGDKYTDTADWMGEAGVTPLLARAPAATRMTRSLPEGLPWLSGYSNLNTVFVEAVALDERLALLWRPQDTTGFEVRLAPGMMPDTLLAAAPGRPFSQFVSHPLLDRFQIRIVAVRQHQKSLRLKLDGGSALWRRVRLKGGNEERTELKGEMRRLRDGRRHLEKVIAGHLTLPGRRGDTEVPWDEVLGEDEIDEFTGRPWPEPAHAFEGISMRRHHEERRHDDGDPAIRFDEDDPASYE